MQKRVGQTTNRNRPRLPSLFGMKFTQVPSQCSNQIWEVQVRNEVWCVQRHLPIANPVKAALPLSSSDNWLHSCRLSIAEKHGANNQQEQSKAPLTVWYEIHTSAQPIQQPICRPNNIAQQFSCLLRDNGTERWRKAVLDNLWRSHIDWHPFGVLEADDYCQDNCWQFGNQLICINYIFTKKNEFKLLYTNYVKDMWSRKD
jgi:hypothetical protein